jgi:hypothetical protein
LDRRAVAVVAIAMALFLWQSKHLIGKKAEETAAEETTEPQIVLREL